MGAMPALAHLAVCLPERCAAASALRHCCCVARVHARAALHAASTQLAYSPVLAYRDGGTQSEAPHAARQAHSSAVASALARAEAVNLLPRAPAAVAAASALGGGASEAAMRAITLCSCRSRRTTSFMHAGGEGKGRAQWGTGHAGCHMKQCRSAANSPQAPPRLPVPPTCGVMKATGTSSGSFTNRRTRCSPPYRSLGTTEGAVAAATGALPLPSLSVQKQRWGCHVKQTTSASSLPGCHRHSIPPRHEHSQKRR